ncbi:MAG: hypothetical protein H0V17_06420 [Deltaproteobacteria bacterium]|nr:hypothetical protein [Deltaproteobacteria bacterium]
MPTTPSLESISLLDLSSVQGGCKKKQQPCPPCPACPPPAAPPSGGGGTEITTNVQMTGFGSAAQ